MPYALIPEGFKLQKVTKLQKAAVDAKRRHDNVEALFNNPSTPTVVGGIAATLLAVKLGDEVIDALEGSLGTLSKETKEAVGGAVAKVTDPIKIGVALGQGVLQTTLSQLGALGETATEAFGAVRKFP
jgi:hypothetical protein